MAGWMTVYVLEGYACLAILFDLPCRRINGKIAFYYRYPRINSGQHRLHFSIHERNQNLVNLFR